MSKRRFLKLVLGAVAALAGPRLRAAQRLVPARYVEALRGQCYPGPRKVFSASEVARPAKWEG